MAIKWRFIGRRVGYFGGWFALVSFEIFALLAMIDNRTGSEYFLLAAGLLTLAWNLEYAGVPL
jgi:hypothetical protein